jgi:hypothetical protein
VVGGGGGGGGVVAPAVPCLRPPMSLRMSDAAAADDSDATVSDLLQDHVAVEHARHAFT